MLGVIPGTEIASDVGIIAAAILAFVSAVWLVPRAISSLHRRSQAKKEERQAEMTRIAEHTASMSVRSLLDTLMTPNGGKSLYDISQRLELGLEAIHHLTTRFEDLDKRAVRLENEMDSILIPKQQAIMHSMGIDRRVADHLADSREGTDT